MVGWQPRPAAACPTIRYYEEIGLLPEADRRTGGHRVYGEGDLHRLTFIRRCRDFGFPIEQIRELVALAGSPERDCTAARDLADMHLVEVRRKLKELRALERTLKNFVEDCTAQCAGGRMRHSPRPRHAAALLLRVRKSGGQELLRAGSSGR